MAELVVIVGEVAEGTVSLAVTVTLAFVKPERYLMEMSGHDKD
jgi:hypothetical protein